MLLLGESEWSWITVKVMFVCKANVGRSQVAEAFFLEMSKNTAISSGTHVDEEMAKQKPASAKLKDNSKYSLPYMLTQGIDISEQVRNQLTPRLVAEVDRVVAILSEDEIPAYVKDSGKLTVWDIPDPATNPDDSTKLFDAVKQRVSDLVQEIG